MLEIIAFCCGALVMVLEMVGARVLAPHVGTSAVVWTSLIGVVLACLALGAWLGGRLADRHLSRRGLALILLGASLGSALAAGTLALLSLSIITKSTKSSDTNGISKSAIIARKLTNCRTTAATMYFFQYLKPNFIASILNPFLISFLFNDKINFYIFSCAYTILILYKEGKSLPSLYF